MVHFLFMVSQFLNSNDRPNPTSWFWFNQWPNPAHLYTPGKPKAHISWLCEQNWNSKSRLGFLRSQSQIACEPQNWKLWKTNQLNEMALVWCKTTQIRQFNENKIFPQRDLSNFGNLNFFPPLQCKYTVFSQLMWTKNIWIVWVDLWPSKWPRERVP